MRFGVTEYINVVESNHLKLGILKKMVTQVLRLQNMLIQIKNMEKYPANMPSDVAIW